MDYEKLSQTHDLSLPSWGPYSSSTFGISHIHEADEGSRIDFTLMPGFYRRPLAIPDARKPSGGIPWRCSSDLRHYSYRQQLEWKDQIYAELEFDQCRENCQRLRCKLINNTSQPCELALQLLAQLVPVSEQHSFCPQALAVISPRLAGCGLVSDAMQPGEELSGEPVIGRTTFTVKAGEAVLFPLPSLLVGEYDAYIYCKTDDTSWQWEKTGWTSQAAWSYRPLHDMQINRLVIVHRNVLPTLETRQINTEIRVECLAPDRFMLFFPGKGDVYGIVTSQTPSFYRNYLLPNLLECFVYRDFVLQKHFGNEIKLPGGKQGGFSVAIQPIVCEPRSGKTIDFLVWNGSESQVRKQLEEPEDFAVPAQAYLELAPSPYHFSIERMASVVMTNAIYPILCQGKYIRNHTPGRLWNSLYTWDSGFIGLGLLELDTQRAIENLNAYLTPAGDPDNAFVLHGTPLPMQIYLLYELWNRTCNRELLRHFYPRCKQMYDFLAGHGKGSTTRSHCTAPLLSTWDYFYNSGGWDDYPPQWEYTLHPEKQEVIPVIPTACAIRVAKLLCALAELLEEDTAVFKQDINDFSDALQQYSWDEQAGYFSYVTVDDMHRPMGFFRYVDGSNFNMGLDGVSPLISACITPQQRKQLWDKVQSPRHLWSPSGITTIDQSASYFTLDGYWNGSVWMPHQWLLWKAALNDGLGEFANKIAQTALNIWERETQRTYACLEHFSTRTGAGMGWHHFSGLSTPIICWHQSYFSPKQLTAGFDVRIDSRKGTSWHLTIQGNATDQTALVIGGQPASISYNDQPVAFTKTFANSAMFYLKKNSSGILKIVF